MAGDGTTSALDGSLIAPNASELTSSAKKRKKGGAEDPNSSDDEGGEGEAPVKEEPKPEEDAPVPLCVMETKINSAYRAFDKSVMKINVSMDDMATNMKQSVAEVGQDSGLKDKVSSEITVVTRRLSWLLCILDNHNAQRTAR